MRRIVSFLIYDDFQILDLAGPLGAFEAANWHAGGQAYRLQTLAPRRGLIASSSGAQVQASAMSTAGQTDTLVVVGGRGSLSFQHDQRIRSFLTECAGSVRRVCSVCSGAQLLAAAGLLDGRRATTHWRIAQHVAQDHPSIRLSADAIHVRDGKFWTSAGVTAGIDLALALVQDDLGEAISRAAAQELVVYHRRPGGQSQFSALSELGGGDRFASLFCWIRENLTKPLTVEQLAAHAAMSTRNFSRAFLAETGVTPAKAVERVRVEAARAKVEGSAEPFASIARSCGFGDADRMRRAFLRIYGHVPQQIRRAAN